jgi:ribosomal protein L3
MLADPRLAKPEPVGQHDLVDVSLVSVGQGAVGWVQRHHEQSEFHARF